MREAMLCVTLHSGSERLFPSSARDEKSSELCRVDDENDRGSVVLKVGLNCATPIFGNAKQALRRVSIMYVGVGQLQAA